ncbi:pheromone-binding protein Gp-9-like [Temnothorax longispinosus]|uniref:pheromone-binding protein Gp-9-like n=1 Tax=Temnothorax longispinosus TaxID=300112 RepID=UPI003A98D3FB
MKSLVLCACVLVLAFQSSSSSEIKDRLKSAVRSNLQKYAEPCFSENNATGDDRYTEEDIMTNLYAKPENAERTRKNGCVIACVMKKQDLMEGTNIKEAQVHVRINEVLMNDGPVQAEAHRIMRKCMKKVRSITQECEKSFSLHVCIVEAMDKLGQHNEHELDSDTEDEAVTEQAE